MLNNQPQVSVNALAALSSNVYACNIALIGAIRHLSLDSYIDIGANLQIVRGYISAMLGLQDVRYDYMAIVVDLLGDCVDMLARNNVNLPLFDATHTDAEDLLADCRPALVVTFTQADIDAMQAMEEEPEPEPEPPATEEIKPEPQTDLEIFRAAIAGKDYLILDTETTGLHEGEIIQIAIINSAGDTLLNSYVKPVEPIPADSRRIHGISDEMVADAPTWAELAPKVREILDGQLLIVYNATYDRKMMHQSAERNGMDKIEWKEIAEWHCAMIAFAELYGEWNDWHGNYRWKRLTDAARYCAVPVDAAHDALGDCLMTLGVVRHMIKGGA